ncbi:hypothetical protein HYW46_03470 [Candidatus Daviesbacteria bacterium]|nr:hypothetical protein [Candidatus Daviesbacteria bacterium]
MNIEKKDNDMKTSEWFVKYLQSHENYCMEDDILEEILTMEEEGVEDLVAVVNDKKARGIFRAAAIDRLSHLIRDTQKERFLDILRINCDKDTEHIDEVREHCFGWRYYLEEDKQSLNQEALKDPNFNIQWLGTFED